MKGCPVAYLVGRKEFFSLEFEVNRDVLIPRPDTECVVDECLRLAKEIAGAARSSTSAPGRATWPWPSPSTHKTAQVTAVDLSAAALAVASRNAAKHGVAERIRFLRRRPVRARSRPASASTSSSATRRTSRTPTSPPWRPASATTSRTWPWTAAPDGFAVFDRLIAGAPERLKPGGYLIVEIGSPQEAPARQRIEAAGGYELGKTILDGSRHPRVLRARLRPAG